MRLTFAALSLSIALAGTAPAQPADPAALKAEQVEKLKPLAWMDGVWRGDAVTQTPSGEKRVTQTERIGPFLGGTVKVIEGRGYNPDGTVGFNAFGTVVYNPAASKYEFHAFSEGRAGVFKFEPTADGYIWESPAGGPAIIRYTASFKDKTWTEIGEYVSPGAPARQFFKMSLRRIGDTKWPLETPVPQK